MTGKRELMYAPLEKHLRSLDTDQWRATFEDIEKIIGQSLPPSARTHKAWWGNGKDRSRQSYSWLDAGWKVKVDFNTETAVFYRRI